jgi:drug/metabolite transporter (DMT)-like permease
MADQTLRRRIIATSCIVGCIGTWIAMAEILQDVQTTYPKPLFIAYCVRSSFSMCLLYFVPGFITNATTRGRVFVACRSMLKPCSTTSSGNSASAIEQRRLHKRLALSFFGLTLLVLIGGYLWYRSLSFTTVPTNTVVSQMLCVMVFGISVCVLGEKLTILKFLSVGICFAGKKYRKLP